MRIKLDENLPAELGDDLRGLGHDVDSVVTERLAGRPDSVVVTAARKADRILFTLDKGIGARSRERGPIEASSAARGFRENFKTAIYCHCGGLELYPD